MGQFVSKANLREALDPSLKGRGHFSVFLCREGSSEFSADFFVDFSEGGCYGLSGVLQGGESYACLIVP